MKTRITFKPAQQGTALLVALFLTTILAVTIAGYLKHAYQQHYISMRSQVWNSSIAVSEAGIEEALQHLNTNPTNLSANGWVASGSLYSMKRYLTPSTRYEVTIDAADMISPKITSVAYLSPPSLSSANSGLLMAAIGVDSSLAAQNAIVSRGVQVKARKDALFVPPNAARKWIDMNGNNIQTDSFNSTDPNHSDNGMYPSGKWWKILDNGDLASNGSIENSVNVGNANIYGRVSVGPGGTVAVGGLGGVGTRLWQSSNPGQIQPGYFSDDMNFTFPSITLPYTAGLTPTSGSISTTNYSFASTTNMVTTTNYPSPAPTTGVTSNISYMTVSFLPTPIPYGCTTNVLTTVTNSPDFPASGTYVGSPTKRGSKWYYDLITGYNYTYPFYTYTYSLETTVTNFTVSTTDYDYVIQGSSAGMPPLDYYVTEIPKGDIYVTGNARLVVRNSVKQAGTDALVIATDGKLQMWVGGPSIDLTGGGILNRNGYAQNMILWATDAVTSVAYRGNGELTGILVAPNADLKLLGGGSAYEDFIGAVLANTITLNGHYHFHYDEALRNLDSDGRYKVIEWNEVTLSQAIANR